MLVLASKRKLDQLGSVCMKRHTNSSCTANDTIVAPSALRAASDMPAAAASAASSSAPSSAALTSRNRAPPRAESAPVELHHIRHKDQGTIRM